MHSRSYLLSGSLVVVFTNKQSPSFSLTWGATILSPYFSPTSYMSFHCHNYQAKLKYRKIPTNPSKMNSSPPWKGSYFTRLILLVTEPTLEVVMLSEVCSENADLSFTAAWFCLSSPFDLYLAMLHSHTSILMPVDSQIALHIPIN